MQVIRVNRFKAYRLVRWCRTAYLWSDANPYLLRYGIEVTADASTPCDVLAIPCPHLPGREGTIHRDDDLRIRCSHRGLLDFQDTPLLCDGSTDYAYVDPVLADLLAHPQVRFYLPNVSFRSPELQQRMSWGGEYYGHVFTQRELYQCGPNSRFERPPLAAEVQRKIAYARRPTTPPFPDVAYEYIAAKIKPLDHRPVDLFFAGRTWYGSRSTRNFATAMRQRLTQLWPQLPGSNNVFRDYHNYEGTKKFGKSVQSFAYPFDYIDQLLNAKIVISPWGWSPWCIRDFEALACGCIVVKPECSNMLVSPDIYDPKQNLIVWCDVMFDYIEQQLQYILDNLTDFQERADRGRTFVTDAMYPLDKVQALWTEDIRGLLERCLEGPAYTAGHMIPASIS